MGEIEKEVELKMKLEESVKSFKFRAPQENFTIQDFDMGKIYGVGSYSKVGFYYSFFFFKFYYSGCFY